jgi:hypothetical protein
MCFYTNKDILVLGIMLRRRLNDEEIDMIEAEIEYLQNALKEENSGKKQ